MICFRPTIKIEPLRHVGFIENQLAQSVLNGSAISVADLFALVKGTDEIQHFEHDQNVAKSSAFRQVASIEIVYTISLVAKRQTSVGEIPLKPLIFTRKEMRYE